MIYRNLLIEFLKIGLFSFGGGYGTIPFLYALVEKYHWFDVASLSRSIAIAEVLPGPVGMNTATYAGFLAGGIAGGIMAGFALIVPALAIILLLMRFFPNFSGHPVVQRAFYGLRPVVVALVAMAAGQLLYSSFLLIMPGWKYLSAGILLAGLLLLAFRYKCSPVILLAIGAVWGFLFL